MSWKVFTKFYVPACLFSALIAVLLVYLLDYHTFQGQLRVAVDGFVLTISILESVKEYFK